MKRVKLNKKLLRKKGLKFPNQAKLFDFLKHKAEYLKNHNKNYTTEQYYLIDMLNEILSCFEIND